MSSPNSLAPAPAGRVHSARFVPPLPPGIPILPGQVTTPGIKSRLPVGLVIILVLAGLGWFSITHSNHQAAKLNALNTQQDEDDRLILAAVTPAMMAHAPRWTRIPVTLSDGKRIIQIEFTVVHHQPGKAPATCVWLGVLDPITGARVDQKMPCVSGLDYLIQQQ
jgi:hypothetical protein